jgi:uncharacterized damage-inducible protein DinB
MDSIAIPTMSSRACRAIAEESEAERGRLYDLLGRFRPEALATGNVETEDNVRGILCHVTFAILSYACWLARVRGRLEPEVEKREKAAFLEHVRSQSDAAGFAEASRRASERLYAVMAEIAESELDGEHRSNWGITYSIEAMLEHALVHLMRHRRQLEIHLGLRPGGAPRG